MRSCLIEVCEFNGTSGVTIECKRVFSDVVRLQRTSNYDNCKLCRNAQNLYICIYLGHKLTYLILTYEAILSMSLFSR